MSQDFQGQDAEVCHVLTKKRSTRTRDSISQKVALKKRFQEKDRRARKKI